MKKLIFIVMFLMFLMSFIVLSFAEFKPIADGEYVFQGMSSDEKLGFIVKNNKMLLITENSDVVLLNLYVDPEGRNFYSDNNGMDIYFYNVCSCMIIMPKEHFVFLNIDPTCNKE